MSQTVTLNSTGWTGSSSLALVLRGRSLATWIAVGVVLCALIVIFVSYGSWRNDGRAKVAWLLSANSERE